MKQHFKLTEHNAIAHTNKFQTLLNQHLVNKIIQSLTKRK